MKLTYNWLKDFVDIKISPKELADKITMAGLEVLSLEKKEGDFILELEITSNRSDCLSVIGIAREIAAITNEKLKLSQTINYKLQTTKKSKKEPPFIKIEDKRDCPLYTARVIKNVKVRNSPDWLRKRLENIGIRSVNNITDITNYVLIETGQPLHAFDYDKLKDHQVIVRRAREGEKIVTIDGIERELNKEILVISDTKNPIAIAGIMGGKETEVTQDTKNILLESAEFNPLIIRRATRFLGLQTESSYRFERSIDKSGVVFASVRACNLIERIAKGEFLSFKIKGDLKEKERFVFLDLENVERILGERIFSSQIKRILKDLRFKILERKNKLKVYIPAFRKDIKEEIDLIEEIARISGYDNIPQTLPYIKVSTLKEPIQDLVKEKIKSSLLKLGLNEVITYSLLPLENLIEEEKKVEIKNPISKETSILRPNLLFSLLKVLSYNLNRRINSVGIFELAKIYKYESIPEEKEVLGILVWGQFYSDWLRNQKLFYSFFDLKGIIEVLLKDLGIEDYKFQRSQIPYLSQGSIFCLRENNFGFLGKIDEKILEKFDLNKNLEVYFSQIQIEDLISFVKLKKEFKPLPLFPSVKRDISLIVKKDISCGQILETIKELGGELLSNVFLFDQYIGEPIPKDCLGLAFSLEYRSKERTLTDEEINSLHKIILENLEKKLGAKIRQNT